MADPADVSISLTAEEALVLFDLQHRWEDDDRVSAPQHGSEQVALWNLSALLGRVLDLGQRGLDRPARPAMGLRGARSGFEARR